MAVLFSKNNCLTTPWLNLLTKLLFNLVLSAIIFDKIYKKRHIHVISEDLIKCHTKLHWEKGKPLGSIDCMGKQQSRFYWSCSSVVIKDTTPMTPSSAWEELLFSNVKTYNPWSLRNRKIRGNLLQTLHRHLTPAVVR